MTTTTSVLGGAIRRREDPALIQGEGRYVDDIKLSGTVHAAFVRSPYAHARIASIDTLRAEEMEGVHAVYVAEDVRHLGPVLAQVPVGKLRPLLADGMASHVGESVAMVVADSRALADDAAEAVDVDYEPLPAVVDLKQAASDKVKVHDELDSNIILTWECGPWGNEEGIAQTKEEIAQAKQRDDVVVVSQEMINQRLIPTAIEPRAVLADWNRGYQRFEVYSSTQVPHALAGAIAKTFGLASNSVRVLAPEVGGGFGAKLNIYNDEVLVAFAAQQLGRPVKYTEERRESPNSTIQGRGWVGTATVTGTRDGEVLGYELHALCDMGAYTQNFTVAIPFLGVFVGSGQYKFPIHMKLDCVTTHTMTTDAYRGAGRPEAIYYLERILDEYAAAIGMDPADVRRRNYIPASEFPGATAPVGFAVDTGDYEKNLDAALKHFGWDALLQERDLAREEGRNVGVGLTSYVEVCGFGPSALADLGFSWSEYGLPSSFNGSGLVRVNPDGSVTTIIGTGPTGQGHETTWAQIVSRQLGIDEEKIRVRHGDTAESPMGIGTFGSRSAAVDGPATHQAALEVKAKAAKIAAHLLEAAEEDIRFENGQAHVAGSPDRSLSWEELAKAAYQPHLLPEGLAGGLEAHSVFSPANATWPFGTHIAMVEVDTDTGDVDLLRYLAMDDCGTVINPMIVDGQIHGGLAQGIGQALFEDAIYDGDGNLLTGSLVDYPLPTATDLPTFELARTVTPTDINPLGVKGIGEAGTIGSAQTIVNAVVDALRALGVKHIDMPLRPKRVWQAIQAAQNGSDS
ncbi:MAG TPA: xanthine dehydrogenase family protein molybdopterin-binding subunit [Acidimicrobiia bacterium]|nr:xanthine dehydrogenase family protein molybdopterin-binding subunit [Acidimicrobiia bacterium]